MNAGVIHVEKLRRHGSLNIAVTEKERKAGQELADKWAPPAEDMYPYATVSLDVPSTWTTGSGGSPQAEITPEHIRQLAANCEQTGREHQQGKRAPEQYTCHGKPHRTKVKGSSVNASHVMEDIHEYVESLP